MGGCKKVVCHESFETFLQIEKILNARFEIFAVTFAFPLDMRTSLEQQVLDTALRAKIFECKFEINLKPFLAVQDLFTNIT